MLFTREHRGDPLCESLASRAPDALKRLRDTPLNIGLAQDPVRDGTSQLRLDPLL